MNHDYERHTLIKRKSNAEVIRLVSEAIDLEASYKKVMRIIESKREGCKITWETFQTTKIYKG